MERGTFLQVVFPLAWITFVVHGVLCYYRNYCVVAGEICTQSYVDVRDVCITSEILAMTALKHGLRPAAFLWSPPRTEPDIQALISPSDRQDALAIR